ncbi:MAG TPA: adenylate/guanylate cyclase domain-containing protein, partial [Alphaproteobacteria bacterium]|nr:adenylate/guanylate cyclase domain-containing protein [Alphaproteobacteria bacterium]
MTAIPAEALSLIRWLTEAGLAAYPEDRLLTGFCDRALAAGLPLWRVIAGLDTLHPVLGGRVFEWLRGRSEIRVSNWERADTDLGEEKWRASPLYRAYEANGVCRVRLPPQGPTGYTVTDELRDQGATDYLAVFVRFDDGGLGGIDGIFGAFATDRPDGFSAADIALIEAVLPQLGLVLRSLSNAHIAESLVETYLGRDAGRRVLRGHIERGVAERMDAVLWFSDLQGFTRITDTLPTDEVIPLLNDYADAIASAVHEQGGQVLKFMGDGMLAIFDAAEREAACCRALDAYEAARDGVAALNVRRGGDGRAVTEFYLGLHVGEVFYGNIGSADRLDFTVVGPAVNEVSRIASMCRSVDRHVVMSSDF